MNKRQCVICSTEFEPKSYQQICCSKECSKEHQHIRARWNNKIRSEKQKKEKAKKKKKLSLTQINKLAREKGMSYGQYIVWLDKQEVADGRTNEHYGLS